jgi:antitoxin HigA-1
MVDIIPSPRRTRGRRRAALRRLPPALYGAARRKILYLHDADDLRDLRLPPGNGLEALKGDRIGWTRARLNEFIRGKRGVTADAALDLAEALGTSSRLWMNLQSTWDLDAAAKRRRHTA